MPQFMFATGIENSNPTIEWHGRTIRQDELEKTRHYERWKDDFRLLQELEIQCIRYGPPYHLTHVGPGRYDWSFADDTLETLHRLGVIVIADLCHFGVPDWIGDFQNPDWPRLFAEYARAFAARYQWVRFYTPVNEILIAATFSAQFGWWNERLHSDHSFVTALKHLCTADVLAIHAILEGRPDAIFIHSESTQYFHAEDPECEERARTYNEKRFLAADLVFGHHVDDTMYEYLMDSGMSRSEYHWFFEHPVKNRCVMGNDYYFTNESVVHRDGSLSPSGEVFGYYPITHQYFSRYRLPVMHTETNCLGGVEPVRWLRKEWANVHRLKKDGVPLVGFTWYSLQDQVDWNTSLRENNGHVDELGLCDLDRNIRPVGYAYRHLIQGWRDLLPTESNVLRI
ncbi:MAG TPA: family 1 glycosylhydrolase [Vicinamibacterales bacterium]|nr:family 1 glycosylhydrolase [Vicinamibacterales bacterium]